MANHHVGNGTESADDPLHKKKWHQNTKTIEMKFQYGRARWKIWNSGKRLDAFKLTKEDNKKKTCAPLIYMKMMNEKNYTKYEKHTHTVDVNKLHADDGIDHSCNHFKNIAGVSEVQAIGPILDKYFNIVKKSEEPFSLYELRERRRHDELRKMLTTLGKMMRNKRRLTTSSTTR